MTSIQIQSERGQDPSPDLNFTVHEYHNSVSRPLASPQSIVKHGFNAIKSAVSRDAGWQSIRETTSHFNVETSNAYSFNVKPPISPLHKEIPQKLKEWGSEVTEDEVFTLDSLDEFQSLDLRHIFQKASCTTTSSQVTAVKSIKIEATVIKPEVKERRLKTSSLFRVIPQPHLYPTPSVLKKRTVNAQYTKCKPSYISPCTPDTYPKDSRVGWIIPLRGLVPWDNCTSGEVLDGVMMPSPAQPGILDQISWTQDAIVEFWHYLLQLRKSGTLGRLAVSFQPSKSYRYVSTSADPALDTSKATGTSNIPHPSRNLSEVDFIKVYQDAVDAPYVRNAIDVFRYQHAQENGMTQKIRVLKASKLALVDALSQGILIL